MPFGIILYSLVLPTENILAPREVRASSGRRDVAAMSWRRRADDRLVLRRDQKAIMWHFSDVVANESEWPCSWKAPSFAVFALLVFQTELLSSMMGWIVLALQGGCLEQVPCVSLSMTIICTGIKFCTDFMQKDWRRKNG